ncbi:Factor arrest protein 11 [Maudiozyma exigua]|uniref:Factor arrest protein 11 n=1 Tax=Maudiozyma exigua TaxID=34358 RepID=A0A9P6WDD9_MAUEX|nr:Factor arrest protein 11 [Kazachstania exigua]
MDEESDDKYPDSGSHITRSTSVDNLNLTQTEINAPMFHDDTVTANRMTKNRLRIDTGLADNPLLSDLDIILRNKLRISPESPVISRNNSLNNLRSVSDPKKHAFMKELGLDGDIATVNQGLFGSRDSLGDSSNSDSSDEESGLGDEEDDEEFTNVDEIDGPIGMHLPEKKTSVDTKQNDAVDYNLPANQDFQKSIDKRVAELENGISAESQPVLKIDWKFQNTYGLEKELNDWFSASDYSNLAQTINSFARYVPNKNKFVTDDKYARAMVEHFIKGLSEEITPNLLPLFYISMGNFSDVECKEDHIRLIRRNNIILFDSLLEIVRTFKTIAVACRDEKANLKKNTILLFYTTTILFIITNVAIEKRNDDNSDDIVREVIEIFDSSKMLQFLTEYIEYWRWNSRLSMRIRNIISLLFNMFLLQFGDVKNYEETKDKIYKFHNIKRREKSSERLFVSPLQFQAFQDDITSRFPTFEMVEPDLPMSVDNTNSLSQFLEIARSKAKSSLNSTLPIPEKQLATPAPSPPMSPMLIPYNDGIKTRKSFQANMAYPYLYPSDDEKTDDLSERIMDKSFLDKNPKNDIFTPRSVEEAAEILTGNLNIGLSVRQLWNERDLFMATERGWDRDEISKKFNYSLVPEGHDSDEIRIMKRIDSYYKDCFSSFNSLIFVLCQIMESNLTNVEHKEDELPKGVTVDHIIPQLEIVKAKELSLKSSAGILFILLKWFKLNHVLKAEQFAVLLYDSGYINTCCAILGKYSLIYDDKVFNRTLQSPNTFWNMCSKFNDTYVELLAKEGDNTETVNEPLLTTITYLLKVLKKVTGNKTHRLKSLPLSVGTLFKQYYRIFNLDIYHPMLRIIRELTPFKNKRWKSEHMDLISGVFLYERLELIDNWVTGKDISAELMDAYGQEVALRALVQFYNFEHYQKSLEELGYMKRTISSSNLLYKDSECGNL